MDIMERIALALEKVEAIEQNENQVYSNLREDLANDIQKAITERPKISNNLDPDIVAKHILPSILGKMPNAKEFGKELETVSQKIVGNIANEASKIQNVNTENVTILIYLNGFLAVLVLIFGLLTWHYSGYKEDAYKYQFAKKDAMVNGNSTRFYGLMDSLAVNDFNYVEKYVDTTEVQKEGFGRKYSSKK